MKIMIAVVAAMLLVGLAHAVVAENCGHAPLALDKKLHGAWKGESACQGNLTVRPNGTFEKTHCGPGNQSFAGTWDVYTHLGLTDLKDALDTLPPPPLGNLDENEAMDGTPNMPDGENNNK